jgi:cytochrome c-type biogenesis protein CcmE
VARKQSPARLVVALSVAAVLVIFLVYTSIAGGTPLVQPSQLPKQHGNVSLAGIVVAPHGSARSPQGLRFGLRDFTGKTTVQVVYHGSVPDLFRVGRRVVVDGTLKAGGVFVARPDTLVTKCPSKYQPGHPQSSTS